MSNIFKSNLRFAALSEELSTDKDNKHDKKNKNKKNDKNKNETPIENKEEKSFSKQNTFNSFKDERPSFKNKEYDKNYFDNKNRRLTENEERRKEQEKERMENEKIEKERKREEALNFNNFPDLIIQENKKQIKNEKQSMSFIEKIIKNDDQSSNISKNNDPDLDNLKPGWILLKRDFNTGKTIIKRNPVDENKEKLILIQNERNDSKIANQIFKNLTELHEKRTQEYIELYGYDTWEKMFKCPNWRELEAEFEDSDSEESDQDIEDESDEYYEYN
jgi:hypothetical protein